ncbi:hypothetical protein F4801DRAFT_574828 [Xylaria longipes]|nr:hypothetical protein F4801DRAFT_574828 [Xylaria longipes]
MVAAPVLRQVHISRGPKQMDARLSPNYSDPTALIYSFPPSPEVEAWARITARSVIGITREDITRIGDSSQTTTTTSGRGGFEPPIMFELHLRHCTNMLLQTLMCHSDVEIVTNTWSEAQPWPYADFAVTKQCRDFEKLLEWTESQEIAAATHNFSDYRASAGTVRIPEEPLLREEMGMFTSKDKNGDELKLLHIKNCNA